MSLSKQKSHSKKTKHTVRVKSSLKQTKHTVFTDVKSSFSLSKESQEIIKKEMIRYETKLSCLIPCLWQIQKEKGWISKSAVSWLSGVTQIPESHIFEVLMFYTMFNKKPVGKFHIQVCANVSCALKGSRELIQLLCRDFNVKEDEKSACGTWTVSKVECLGACDEAPVIQLNDEYIGNIKIDSAADFLKSKLKTL